LHKLEAKKIWHLALLGQPLGVCFRLHSTLEDRVLCKEKRHLLHSRKFQSDKAAYLSTISNNFFLPDKEGCIHPDFENIIKAVHLVCHRFDASLCRLGAKNLTIQLSRKHHQT